MGLSISSGKSEGFQVASMLKTEQMIDQQHPLRKQNALVKK